MGDENFTDGFGLSSTRHSLPIALLRARETVMDRFRPHLSQHDLTEQQWRVLRVLNEAGELDATKLARRASVLMPSLTRILKLLDARGLIAVRRDPGDKRRALATLTETGQRLIVTAAPRSAEIYRDIENAFGEERLNHLLDELDDLIAALSLQDGSDPR